MGPRGEARSTTGKTYQALLAVDTREPPKALRAVNFEWLGDEAIETARYTSPGFAALENERLWANVWQMACRLEPSGDGR